MKKILIVDDEKEVLDMLGDFFSSRGYTTITAADGEEALKNFDENIPDIIICDIKMPKMDGYQFLKTLRNTRRWVPVIILSALTEPINIFKGYDCAADYYITKPIILGDALKAVQTMLSIAPLRKT